MAWLNNGNVSCENPLHLNHKLNAKLRSDDDPHSVVSYDKKQEQIERIIPESNMSMWIAPLWSAQ